MDCDRDISLEFKEWKKARLKNSTQIPFFKIPVCMHTIWTAKEASMMPAWKSLADTLR
jgi:hypothetical protein